MSQAPINYSSLGEWLLDLRQSTGLEQADLSGKTKISARFLDALERGDLDSLPTRVHARAFALAYAKACDADEDEALKIVAAAFDAPQVEAALPALKTPGREIPGRQPQAQSASRAAVPWRIWIALGVAVVLSFWGLNSLVRRLKAPAAKPSAVSIPLKPGEAAASAVTPSAEAQGEILALRSRRPCWVVLQIDGKRLPTILLEPNVKEQWMVKTKAVMMAGNIGAVRVWWRGENLGYFGELGERMNGVVFEAGQPWRKDSSQDLSLPPGVPSQAARP